MRLFEFLIKCTRGAGGIASGSVAAAGSLMAAFFILATAAVVSPAFPKEPAAHPQYGSLPLAFEVNRGQADPRVKFLARGNGYTVFLTSEGAQIALGHARPREMDSRYSQEAPSPDGPRKPVAADSIHLRLIGANPAPAVEGLDPMAGRSNYFIGNDPHQWLTNVPTYARVRCRNIYPGIDLVYYGNQRQLEFDFAVAPGADLDAVHLKIAETEARKSLQIDSNGDLVVRTAAGQVRFRKPRVYQTDGGRPAASPRLLPAHYRIEAGGQIGFEVSGYDPSKPLVIDPVLSYSTYLGGTGFDQAYGIAVDASGNSYITGYTTSTDLPASGGAQSSFAGGSCDTDVNTAPCFDAFVAKLNPQGSAVVYSTYLGGTGDDRGIRIAIDGSGDAYVAGYTNSLNFPTASPLQASLGAGNCGSTLYPAPCYDAFVAKLNPTGSSLIYSTYLGGTGDDFASSIAVDSSGNAYVAGLTSAADFSTTFGALQTTFGGGPFDGFVVKISPSGTSRVYSTYLGGSGEDHVAGIALDSSGDAYLTGQTNSSNFPSLGGFQPAYAAGTCGSSLSNAPCFDAFVTKLNPSGSAVVYSSYLGGTGGDYGAGIALDASGNAYVTGWTTSKDFPVTSLPYEKDYSGSYEAFVSKVSAAGNTLLYATYLGGSNPAVANSIAVDASGNAYVAGHVYGGGFPVVLPLQTVSGGFYDGFVAELNAAGSGLVYSTYLGGSGDDYANDIALDSSGNAYVAGATFSTNFPVTASVLATAYVGGSYDAWVAKISPQSAAGLTLTPNPVAFASQEIQTTSPPVSVLLGDAGSAALNISNVAMTGDFAETNNCGGTIQPGTTCPFSLTFKPTAVGVRTGSMTITDNAGGSPQTIALAGYGTSGAVSLSAASLNFGPVLVGTTSASQSVTLTNVAPSPLNISGIRAYGDFVESTTCGSVINPGAACTISISFTPPATGLSVGSVAITDTAVGSPQTITLTGTGVIPQAVLSVASLSFAAQGVGTTSASQSVTLSNTGQAPLAITSIGTSGNFAQSNNCGGALAAGANCTINVTFTPLQTGSLSGALQVVDNAPGSPQTVTLSGSGIISVSLTAKQSSVTVLAGTGEVQFTLSASVNGGSTTPVVLGCQNIAPATCSFNPATISAGGSSTLTVGNLGAVTSPTLNFTVTGTVAPSGSTSSTTGTPYTTGSTSGTVMATLPLTVQFADFTLASSPSQATVQAGQSASFTVTVTPVNGFNLPVALACSGAPAHATCSLSSASVNVSDPNPVKVTLSVTTTARSSAGPPSPVGKFPWGGTRLRWFVFWCAVATLLLALTEARRRSYRFAAGFRMAALVVLAGMFLSSCGGGGSGGGPAPTPGGGTAAGTYTLTVQATAQSLNHSTTVALQVN